MGTVGHRASICGTRRSSPRIRWAKYADPDRMVAAREAGAFVWDLHQRAWTGEFAPARPYDPWVSFSEKFARTDTVLRSPRFINWLPKSHRFPLIVP
jgi:hypothetical protein